MGSTIGKFRVLVAYEPANNGDLPLDVGDEVDSIKDIGNGWVLGRNVTTGASGAFPEDCINRNHTIAGVFSRVKRRPKIVRPEKPAKVTLLEQKKADVDTMPDPHEMPSKPPVDPEKTSDIRYKLFDSDEDQFRGLKAMFHTFWAFLACGILFVLLYFTFGYNIIYVGYAVAGMFVVLVLGFIFSKFIRCACLLMVPTLFTGGGRFLFLTMITGLLLSGPGLNFVHNTQEVTSSLGCSADLVINQTRLLRKHYEKPLSEVAAELLDYITQVRLLIANISPSFEPLEAVLDAMKCINNDAIISVVEIANVSKVI